MPSSDYSNILLACARIQGKLQPVRKLAGCGIILSRPATGGKIEQEWLKPPRKPKSVEARTADGMNQR
eukprot:5102238-Pleurochrysis_carterae.AAC.2